MAIHPTFLLIADIAGCTRFMTFHRASLAHAQQVVAQLLEAVIDATRAHLKLAKLEGRSLPAMLGFAAACRNFRNIDRTPPRADTQ